MYHVFAVCDSFDDVDMRIYAKSEDVFKYCDKLNAAAHRNDVESNESDKYYVTEYKVWETGDDK